MKRVFFIMLICIALLMCACSSPSTDNTRSSSVNNTESSAEKSYDAKYGEGSYDADKALLDSMRDSWDSWGDGF